MNTRKHASVISKIDVCFTPAPCSLSTYNDNFKFQVTKTGSSTERRRPKDSTLKQPPPSGGKPFADAPRVHTCYQSLQDVPWYLRQYIYRPISYTLQEINETSWLSQPAVAPPAPGKPPSSQTATSEAAVTAEIDTHPAYLSSVPPKALPLEEDPYDPPAPVPSRATAKSRARGAATSAKAPAPKSTGGPTAKPTRGPASKSASGSASKSTGGPASKSTTGSVSKSTGGQVSKSTGCSSSKSTGGLTSKSNGGLASKSTKSQASKSTGGPAPKSTGGQASKSIGGSASKPASNPGSKPTRGPPPTPPRSQSPTPTRGSEPAGVSVQSQPPTSARDTSLGPVPASAPAPLKAPTSAPPSRKRRASAPTPSKKAASAPPWVQHDAYRFPIKLRMSSDPQPMHWYLDQPTAKRPGLADLSEVVRSADFVIGMAHVPPEELTTDAYAAPAAL